MPVDVRAANIESFTGKPLSLVKNSSHQNKLKRFELFRITRRILKIIHKWLNIYALCIVQSDISVNY